MDPARFFALQQRELIPCLGERAAAVLVQFICADQTVGFGHLIIPAKTNSVPFHHAANLEPNGVVDCCAAYLDLNDDGAIKQRIVLDFLLELLDVVLHIILRIDLCDME